jgi:hypothetical protein
MAKLKIDRKAGDNTYLHRDFHGALSTGIEYVRLHYGDQAVRDYLRQFALAWYAPLTRDLREKGLPALREHYARIFTLEGGEVEFKESPDELTLEVRRNPAVNHMRAKGYPISPLFHETVNTVGKTICENTPYDMTLVRYEAETGCYTQRFFRRAS